MRSFGAMFISTLVVLHAVPELGANNDKDDGVIADCNCTLPSCDCCSEFVRCQRMMMAPFLGSFALWR